MKIDEPKTKTQSSQVKKSAIQEVIFATDTMLAECEINSAAYLKPIMQRYRASFPSVEEWSDDVQLVMRGDAVRKLFEAQISKAYDSDLPDLSETTLLTFKNVIRSHNALISLHPDLWELDEAVTTSRKGRVENAHEGLKKIVQFAETKKYLDDETRSALKILSDTTENNSESYILIVQSTIFNFVIASSRWIWLNRKSITAGAVGMVTITYGLSQWMIANETWLLSYFGMDSAIGALLRAALKIVKGLPLA
ncbi:hypothetical protein GCM10022213_15020 [Parerythrobacter jejuensis]